MGGRRAADPGGRRGTAVVVLVVASVAALALMLSVDGHGDGSE